MKSRSFAFRRAVLSLFALSVVLFNFASCKTDDDESGSAEIYGTWTSSYNEVFTITTASLSNAYGTNVIYEGDNLVVSYTNDDKTAGYIYINKIHTRLLLYTF